MSIQTLALLALAGLALLAGAGVVYVVTALVVFRFVTGLARSLDDRGDGL